MLLKGSCAASAIRSSVFSVCSFSKNKGTFRSIDPSWAARLGAPARSTRTRPSSNLGTRRLVAAGGCRKTRRGIVRTGSATTARRSLRFRAGQGLCLARNHRLKRATAAKPGEIHNLLTFVSLAASSISVASTRRYLASPPNAFSTPKTSQLSTRTAVF